MPDKDYWENYWINTPTFELTSVEKPDLSPFLFHMTGRHAIHAILNGQGREEPLPENSGWIRSSIPESSIKAGYNAPVVCLTESPVFCLDFFRFRSGRRWDDDQQYGIGFSKSSLVEQGVRPCVYADSKLCKQINRLSHQVDELVEKLSPIDDDIATEISSLITTIFPLTVSLNENSRYQGFMWEREWRYPSDDGLKFHYSDIKIICSPPEEADEIKEIFGEYIHNIQFVNAWSEYNNITDYLARREINHQSKNVTNASQEKILSLANKSIKQMKRTMLELERYLEVANTFARDSAEVKQQIEDLRRQVSEKEKQIQKLQQEKTSEF